MPKAKKRLTLYIATGLVLVLIIGAVVLMNTGGTQSVAELLSLGERYLLELNYEAALVQFLRVIEIDPMNPRGYHGAARAHIGLGQPEQAIDILNQGIEMTGDAELQALLDEILAAQQAELDRIAQEEAEQERMRREAEDAERERQAEEEAEQGRIAEEERVAQEEAERQAQEEAQREQEAAQPPPVTNQEPPATQAGPRQALAIGWRAWTGTDAREGFIDLDQAARPEGYTVQVNIMPDSQIDFYTDSVPGTGIGIENLFTGPSGPSSPFRWESASRFGAGYTNADRHGLNYTFYYWINGHLDFNAQGTATVVFEVVAGETMFGTPTGERYTVHFSR